MDNLFFTSLLDCRKAQEKPDFFLRLAGASSIGAAGTADDEDMEEEKEKKKEDTDTREKQEREERAAELDSKIASLKIKPETKHLLRSYLGNPDDEARTREGINLAERFLRGELKEEDIERMDEENRSWEAIFNVQREVRKNIQNLQWRAEGYLEMVPRKKKKFEEVLKQMHRLNGADSTIDRELKRLLFGLTKEHRAEGAPGSAAATHAAVLNQDEARQIYMANPVKSDFPTFIAGFRGRIQGAAGRDGAKLFSKLLTLKREEWGIENRFDRLARECDDIVAENLSKAEEKAEQEKLLKIAGDSIGITLREGIAIEYDDYSDYNIPPIPPGIAKHEKKTKITKITFETKPRFDKNGERVDNVILPPVIELEGGRKMTLGRFKKWADASDAVEAVDSIEEVEVKIGAAPYGIKLKKNDTILYYPKYKKDKHYGTIDPQPAYVKITDIRDKKIYFDKPVPYQPGFDRFLDITESGGEMRSVLSFGEFVKWWRRYDVEKAMGLNELRKMLVEYNKLYNKQYGIPAGDNPPIRIERGEQLMYAGDPNTRISIRDIFEEGVVLTTGRKTFPEFFHWVKTNNVVRVPPSQEELEEKKRKEKEETEKKLKEEAGAKEGEHGHAAGHEKPVPTPLARLKDLWYQTTWLSAMDVKNMFKEIKEFVKRKHERRSKERYGLVGSKLGSILGAEFERVRQSAQDEEVEKYKHAMENWGAEKVKRLLWVTKNKDVAKACILTLIHEGEMRWDDHHFWHTLNELTKRYTAKGRELFIPHHVPPGQSAEDMAKRACDELWGKGKGLEWYREQISRFNSRKNDFEYEFKQLEQDPEGTGGPGGACVRMLKDWKAGKYVDPMRYEQMISGAIKFGKMGTADKMFFIIAGVTARNPNFRDETLLSVDRIGELNSQYLNQYPLLDFFTQETVIDYDEIDPATGKRGWKRKLNLKDYEKWVKEEFPQDFEKCKAGEQFQRFFWEKIMMSEKTRTRMSKGIRHAENMDHDDAHMFIPPLTPTEIEQTTTNAQGDMKKFSNSGYANGYAGFSQYFITLSRVAERETDREEKEKRLAALRDAMFGFIRYDGILHNRFKKEEGDRRARLDEYHFQRSTVVDDGACKLADHRRQLRNLIMDIADAYNRREQFKFLWEEPSTGSMADKVEKEKQRKYEARLESLGDAISDMVEEDKGARMIEVIRKARRRADSEDRGLRGVPGCKQKEV